MSVSVEFLAGLYNKHSCYADRLTPEQLSAIHIPSGLETAVSSWLSAKKDVVLLGNPGDGKTHVIRRINDVVKRVKAEVVLDATAESDYSALVRRWRRATDAGRPFCLAINQGPLNQVLAGKSATIGQLDEVKHQRTLLYYHTVPKTPRKVVVVDLNLRTVLNESTIEKALQNLMRTEVLDSCPECFADSFSDVARNRVALNNPQVRERIVQLLIAASYTGRHISMRDLQGFLSYLFFGGRNVSDMVRDPSNLQFRYFNLCFDGEGELFDAVRDVFEPERMTIPDVDEHLWENTGVLEGWLFERPPYTPDHLDDAWELFKTIKRQYFFEHVDGAKLLKLSRSDPLCQCDLRQTETSN